MTHKNGVSANGSSRHYAISGKFPGSEFGGTLKFLREACRINQTKLAELADFDHSYVSRLESGERLPTREAVERLATALKLGKTEEDKLLAAAGFVPRDVASLLNGEPILNEILEILQDDNVPNTYRDNLRLVLGNLAAMARGSLTEESPQLSFMGAK